MGKVVEGQSGKGPRKDPDIGGDGVKFEGQVFNDTLPSEGNSRLSESQAEGEDRVRVHR